MLPGFSSLGRLNGLLKQDSRRFMCLVCFCTLCIRQALLNQIQSFSQDLQKLRDTTMAFHVDYKIN